MPINSPSNKKVTRNYLLVSPVLMYEEYIVTPGRRVNLIEGMYIDYTVVAVSVSHENGSNDVRKWVVSITGSNEKPITSLPNVGDSRTDFTKVYNELNMFGYKSLSKFSRKVRVDLHKWGGCGISYNSVNGWDGRCSKHEPSLHVADVLPWFTGFEGHHTYQNGLPNPRHVKYVNGKQRLNLYDDLLRTDVLDMESRMSQLSGVEFFDVRGSMPYRFSAPCFFYHALPDYADEYRISTESVSERLKDKRGSKRVQVINPNYDQIHGHASELNKLAFKDGKLLKPEAAGLITPKVFWVPVDKMEDLDSTALRMCVNMQSVSV